MPGPSIDSRHPAVVLGLFDTGLGAVRSLGRCGIRVVGLDSNSHQPGFRSRYCTSRVCPDPVREPEQLVEFVVDISKQLEQPAVLFPTSDAFVLFLSRCRDELAPYFRYALPGADIVEALVDKRRQYELADELGTPYPRTFYPEHMDDIPSVRDALEYPAFIKPYYGHLWRQVFGGTHKGFAVRTPAELEERLRSILPSGIPVLVQSVVIGPNTNHFKVCAYLTQSGRPLAVFTLRKIRQYPTAFGVGTLVESVHDPELAQLGLQFLIGMGYQGIGSIEFKRDDRDGQLKLIELNPRLWQQNGHATACGINFPLLEYLDLTGQDPQPMTDFASGVKWLDAVADMQAVWEYCRRGELSPWSWLRSLVGTRAFATFAADDPGPFLRANGYGLKYVRLPRYLAQHRHI